MNCEFCSSPVHVWFQCPKKPDGWKPARLARESMAARKEVLTNGDRSVDAPAPSRRSAAGSGLIQIGGGDAGGEQTAIAGTQALPVDTNPVQDAKASRAKSVANDKLEPEQDVQILRPGPKFNKNEYQCRYMREVYRPRLKAKKDLVK